jgi:hypothetical protein
VITPVGQADYRRSFVRGTVIRSLAIVMLTAIAAVISLSLFGDQNGVVLKAAFTAGGVVVALTVLNRFAALLYLESERPSAGRWLGRAERDWPADLLEIEARVSLGKVSAFDHQSRLRPLLRALALDRLAASRRLDIARQPDEVRSVLGAELWDEVQPRSAFGDLREAPGPTNAAIRRMVEKIESI